MPLHPMCEYLLSKGGKSEDESWLELADKFGITPDKDPRTRYKNAHSKWRDFLGTERGLEFKRATFDKHGNITSHTVGRATEGEAPDFRSAKWVRHTTNPNGRGWTQFVNAEGYGLTNEQAVEVGEKLQGIKFDPPKVAASNGVGIVDFSDLHTGAVLKYSIETVKTMPFDLGVLTEYLDEAVAMVNAYGFEKLYVFLPGDIVETFTAFNHRDTFKHIQFFQGGVTIVAYQILKRIFENLQNVAGIYMVEGNHDRLTSDKEGNTRKGIAELLAFFLQENGGVNVNYHPFIVSAEIDGVFHLCTHGDHKPFLKNDFWFRHGKQGMCNVLRTGHFHGFNILRQTHENLHYQCPSIFTGNFFSESLGFDAVPGITIVTHRDGLPQLDYRPLTSIYRKIRG